jgi:predicted enzyme related to lactoylglutathione lyase
MIQSPRYVHTNLIARDWRALAKFYTGVFGCEFVPPAGEYY